jgi:hypothetical protein
MARPSRPRLFALAAFLPLSLACSELEATCPRDSHTAYESRAPFDARARVRRVDCGFQSGVHGLATLPDGSVWLRRAQYKNLEDDAFFLPPDKLLTHVGPGGELLADVLVPDFLQHIVAHPSGEVSVLGWEKQEPATRVQVVRLAADGSQLFQRVLSNDTPVAERLNFEAFADGRLERVEEPAVGRYFTLLAAAAQGEDVYVLAGADGLRLMKFNSRLELLWSRPVTPSVSLRDHTLPQLYALGVPLAGWLVTVDDEGRVNVAHHFLPFQRRAHQEVLGRTPEGSTERGILLSRFEPTGELISERTIPTPRVDELTGLVVRGGAYALGAQAVTAVEGREDKATEADLFFTSGRWDRPAEELVQRTFSLDSDDAPSAFFACGTGRYCFAGHTGFVDVLGTQDLPGQGFILAVDAQGEQQDLLLLQGQRDTQVVQAAEGPGGSVVFAFITNQAANIGAVGNKFKNNESWLGVFGGP